LLSGSAACNMLLHAAASRSDGSHHTVHLHMRKKWMRELWGRESEQRIPWDSEFDIFIKLFS